MSILAVKREDGGISIIVTTNECTPELLERDLKAVRGYVSHREIKIEELPSDRTFRNAWVDNGVIEHDYEKCKKIIRKTRNKSLADLDLIAFAEERKPNGDIKSIDFEAQRLRDIPQHSDFESKDLEKLKSLLAQTQLNVK